jgi:hypothetical protein
VNRLDESYQRDLEWIRDNAARVWQILNADDGRAGACAKGGRIAAEARQREIERRVLVALLGLGRLPEPRFLVGVLVKGGVGDRDAIRDALRRLAPTGALPEMYEAYFTPL